MSNKIYVAFEQYS